LPDFRSDVIEETKDEFYIEIEKLGSRGSNLLSSSDIDSPATVIDKKQQLLTAKRE